MPAKHWGLARVCVSSTLLSANFNYYHLIFMESKNNSIIYLIPIEEFKELISNSFSFGEILRKIHYTNRIYGYGLLKQRISENKIDIAHFKRRKSLDIKSLLKKDTILTSVQRKKIVKEILGEKCVGCEGSNVWNSKPIVLQLDHINGDHFDNRLKNLRVLCPNCHSQTDTFGNKNEKQGLRKYKPLNVRKKTLSCLKCNISVSNRNKSKTCKKCLKKESKTIDEKILFELLGKIPLNKIAIELKVSYKTLRIFCKKNKIKVPGHVYWAKTESYRKKSSDKLKGKPNVKSRKYTYEELYSDYLKTNNYSKTGKKFGVDKSTVRQIILRFKSYQNINN